jgi:hypothetical protein
LLGAVSDKAVADVQNNRWWKARHHEQQLAAYRRPIIELSTNVRKSALGE